MNAEAIRRAEHEARLREEEEKRHAKALKKVERAFDMTAKCMIAMEKKAVQRSVKLWMQVNVTYCNEM